MQGDKPVSGRHPARIAQVAQTLDDCMLLKFAFAEH